MKRNNTEHEIQCAIVEHARMRWPTLETLMFAIPNGGNRDARTGAIMKREGVTAGVWDLCICISRHFSHTLWIEVKDPRYRTRKNGGLSEKQLEWGDDMFLQGHRMDVVYSCQEALDLIEWYLGG